MMTSLRSKWAAGKARGGRISKLIRNRGATRPPAHFHRNPLGRGQLAVFPRCSLLTYRFRYARRSRLEKQPTDRRRKTCLFRGQDTSPQKSYANQADALHHLLLLPPFWSFDGSGKIVRALQELVVEAIDLQRVRHPTRLDW